MNIDVNTDASHRSKLDIKDFNLSLKNCPVGADTVILASGNV